MYKLHGITITRWNYPLELRSGTQNRS